MKLLIGLMSGTSMDGIDAALVDVESNTLASGMTYPYSDQVKSNLTRVLNSETVSLEQLCQLNTLIGRDFASAVHSLLETSHKRPSEVVAVGSHGQTIVHDATVVIPYTLQLGCAHTIAELTGIPVVADFRTRDLVIGGQGAPFAPLYHQVLFGDTKSSQAIVNIGGISNVTYLKDGIAIAGYDVGPGNCLLDRWINQHLNVPFDQDGQWAATGIVLEELLAALLSDPYFALSPPKSLGKEYFSDPWLSTYLKPEFEPQDVQATLVALTAAAIANDLKKSPFQAKRLVLCGGGTHNHALQHELTRQLPGLNILSSQKVGIDPDYIEAMMFAWLADKAMNRVPLDFGLITGAKRQAIYGAMYAPGFIQHD